jgi:hypothetical protein
LLLLFLVRVGAAFALGCRLLAVRKLQSAVTHDGMQPTGWGVKTRLTPPQIFSVQRSPSEATHFKTALLRKNFLSCPTSSPHSSHREGRDGREGQPAQPQSSRRSRRRRACYSAASTGSSFQRGNVRAFDLLDPCVCHACIYVRPGTRCAPYFANAIIAPSPPRREVFARNGLRQMESRCVR